MDGKIGNVAKYIVDDKGHASIEASVGYPEEGSVVKASLKVELDLIEGLREAAKHTSNQLDDAAVDMIAKALGR